jgi:hypothetical protein
MMFTMDKCPCFFAYGSASNIGIAKLKHLVAASAANNASNGKQVRMSLLRPPHKHSLLHATAAYPRSWED